MRMNTRTSSGRVALVAKSLRKAIGTGGIISLMESDFNTLQLYRWGDDNIREGMLEGGKGIEDVRKTAKV